MPGIFAYLRPYPGTLGEQIRKSVSQEDFTLGAGLEVPAGTSNEVCVRLVQRVRIDLLVVPFHLHRGEDGTVLDGVGILLCLPHGTKLETRTIFMPVRGFSWGSSFQRRFDVLRRERPELADRVLVAHQDEVSSSAVATRLRRARRLVNSHGSGRSLTPVSIGPPPSTRGVPAATAMRLPNLPADLLETTLNARENFRRAAEIGARASRDSSEPPDFQRARFASERPHSGEKK